MSSCRLRSVPTCRWLPKEETWAVMLVHPDGVVTATKRVRVVSSY